MRPILLSFFLLSFLSITICQVQQISLKDGSILKGKIEAVTADSTVKIRLQDSSMLEIPLGLVWQVSRNRKDYLFLSGSKVLNRGRYTSVAVHTLSAQKYSDEGDDELRWGMGFHFSFGYQFSPALALGGGFGVDLPDQFYTPIFAEAKGIFVKKTATFKAVRPKQNLRWMGGYFEFEPDAADALNRPQTIQRKQKIAFCYSLQAGFYFPWKEVFDGSDFVSTNPGLMIYPALGFAFPSFSGTAFQIDFGYKFQRHTATSSFPWNSYQIVETIHLNSFAMRAGWSF